MLSLRTLAERLSRNRSFKRRLPPTVGGRELYVSPDAQLKYLRPGFEGLDASLLALAKEFVHPHAKVWDIGSNVGVFTMAAAGLGADVLAVEPDPWLAGLLRSSLRLPENESLKVCVVSMAISDRNGVAELMIAERGRASNALVEAGGNWNMGGTRETLAVPTQNLDTLLECRGKPDLIKIDVEGAESLAIQGARRLLREARPAWIIEVNNSNADYISCQFLDNGYSLYDADQPGKDRVRISKCSFNTLAIPDSL